MSLADELKRAQSRMDLAKKEQNKKPVARKSKARAATSNWTVEDEIIALYLMLSSANKFLIENYALKRNLSKSAMATRMTKFKTLTSTRPDKGLSPQTLAVFDEYSDYDLDDLQKIVISILKHEYQAKALNIEAPVVKSPTKYVKATVETNAAPKRIIRRERKDPSS